MFGIATLTILLLANILTFDTTVHFYQAPILHLDLPVEAFKAQSPASRIISKSYEKLKVEEKLFDLGTLGQLL